MSKQYWDISDSDVEHTEDGILWRRDPECPTRWRAVKYAGYFCAVSNSFFPDACTDLDLGLEVTDAAQNIWTRSKAWHELWCRPHPTVPHAFLWKTTSEVLKAEPDNLAEAGSEQRDLDEVGPNEDPLLVRLDVLG